jgi:hypothetical protein
MRGFLFLALLCDSKRAGFQFVEQRHLSVFARGVAIQFHHFMLRSINPRHDALQRNADLPELTSETCVDMQVEKWRLPWVWAKVRCFG